jgi:hypothetical protein
MEQSLLAERSQFMLLFHLQILRRAFDRLQVSKTVCRPRLTSMTTAAGLDVSLGCAIIEN